MPGKTVIWAGIVLIIIGILMTYAPVTYKWFGRLPGDIRIDMDNGHVFIPITSMIIVSIVITIVFNLFIKR